ncbi:phytanoyl-CoA dioxygenase family protein [uncultured Paracoccus sp.]|uniref:phytanoyl-CoA dioxygenase family protein n=1 Tax=uncultured Paracoccus sp. TaxID=189685 RepID=UPI002607E9E9|nr:phytanoyl-CoA dioxygenase family protein [uncultured Paracoccus sp.]
MKKRDKMSHDDHGLTAAEIRAFIDEGFIRIDHAFSADVALACWNELWADAGLSPDDPSGWVEPVVRVGHKFTPPFVAAGNTPRLHRAYDQLVGSGRWVRPNGLGTFPIRFPSSKSPPDTGWHIDVSFGMENPDFMEWRANVRSRGRALLMLFLISDVGPDDAPTKVRKGSHRILAKELLPYGEAGATLRELSKDNYASSEGCEEVFATGKAGTVYLCHPFLVHSAQPHRGTTPRFMAQPPLLPAGDFDPSLPPSPVQIAIREACGLTISRHGA